MGMLVNGQWTQGDRSPGPRGEFVRNVTTFRDRVTADGRSGFPAEAGRYHLYVSLACPWAHRTLILRKLKGLESAIGLSIVDPTMAEMGWEFTDGPGCIPDTVNGKRYLHQVYLAAVPDYTGRASVPVLWDTQRRRVVNNESREIVRMLDHDFAALSGASAAQGRGSPDYCPPGMEAQVDATIDAIFQPINNGVYRCGFATTQDAYERAFDALFAALDEMEARLNRSRYLAGDRITEADWRLFPTLVRFDSVYHGHFKCNLRRIEDYPNLSNYVRDLYQVPGVAETVDMDHIKRHYYASHRHINPTGIVPRGPALDFMAPHDRARKFARAAA